MDLFRRSPGPGHAGASPQAPEAVDGAPGAPPPEERTTRAARFLSARFIHGVPEWAIEQAAAAERVDPEAVRRQIAAGRTVARPPAAEPDEPVRPRRVDPRGLRVVDLTGLDSVRLRVRGSAYTVSDAGRRRHGGTEYLLIREPDNRADPQAVAVYGMTGVRVGYVSAARAATLSPLLAQLDGDAFKVSGAGTTSGSMTMHVDVPKVEPLRRFVRDAT